MVTVTNIPWGAVSAYLILTMWIYNDRVRREDDLKRRIEREAAKHSSSAESFERLRPALERFAQEDPQRWAHVRNLLSDLRHMERDGKVLRVIFIGGGVLLGLLIIGALQN